MNGGELMVETAFILLMNSLLLMLRIAPGDSFPKPLSRTEEQEYLARWARGDVEARNLLVEHNLRLVAHIMKKYYTQTDDVDDLISIGTIGLIKGVNTYKPDKGVRLATYASRCIENPILSQMRFHVQEKRSLLTQFHTGGCLPSIRRATTLCAGLRTKQYDMRRCAYIAFA